MIQSIYISIAWFNLLFDSVLLKYSISKQIDWICYVWFESRFDKQIKIGSTFILHSCWALDECSVDFRRLSTRLQLFCRRSLPIMAYLISNHRCSWLKMALWGPVSGAFTLPCLLAGYFSKWQDFGVWPSTTGNHVRRSEHRRRLFACSLTT